MASDKAGVSGGSKKLSKATREVLEVISKYNESNCRDKMNEYWLRVIAAVEQAYEASMRAAVHDKHLQQALKAYAEGLKGLLTM